MISLSAFAQNNDDSKHDKGMFKDTLDGKLDVSRFLIDAHGFIPVPQIVTEPALGSIGFLFTPVFIKPNKMAVEGKYIPPDITAAFIGYTGNKSWGVGALRIASLPKYKLKYRAGIAHGDVNMDFYRTFSRIGEQKFSFNFHATGVFGSVLRQIGSTDWYVGLEYFYARNEVTPEFDFDQLPEFVSDKDLVANVSTIGLDAEFDKRDNVFTPDKGWYLSADFRVNAPWTGSDYDYQNLNVRAFKFFSFTSRWVSGYRFESKIQFGDAPFYLKPSISMRGVPMSRYQGDQTYVLETEQRYDFGVRWSAVAFGGLAKAPTEDTSFADAQTVYNYGTGFRYLIARQFKLRMGVDVAWSNNDFGYYIIFGSAWNQRN